MPEDKLFSRFIPKENLGRAAAWNMEPLDGPAKATPYEPTEAEKLAYQRGVEAGRQEGFALAAQQRQLDQRQLERTLVALRARYAELESEGADALLDLAIELARQVVRREVHVDRDAVLPALREAIAGVIDQQAHPRVHLNPDDFELVREELEADGLLKGCRFIPDAQLARGDCRVETAAGEIDARVATRWRRVVKDALGVDAPWLDHDIGDAGDAAAAGAS